MHARDLVEVAALIAYQGPLLVESGRVCAATHVEQYWAASRFRAEAWSQSLKRAATLAANGGAGHESEWRESADVVAEILVSEILTRVWTATLVACEARGGAPADAAIARNVFKLHLEARYRSLGLLLDDRAFHPELTAELNRLRRRAERYADVLIGGLLAVHDVREFAVDPERAADFAIDMALGRTRGPGGQAWRLMLGSLRTAFRDLRGRATPAADANARIVASILACFPAELFDSTGLFHSLWMVRLAATTSDAQGLVSDLLKPALPSRATVPIAPRVWHPRRG